MRQLRDRIEGLEDPVEAFIRVFEVIQARLVEVGQAQLTPVEWEIFCLFDLWSQVSNGGFVGYFGNNAGDDVRTVLAGLRRVEAPGIAAAIERAMALFGPDGPSPDRWERASQTEAWGEEEWAPFEPLEDAVLEDNEFLPERVTRFVRAAEAGD